MSTARHNRRKPSPIPPRDPPFWDDHDPNFPSPGNDERAMDRTFRLYDERGVEEYYYYYPEEAEGRFDGWRRGPNGLEPIASTHGWTSPLLGVTFETPPVDNGLVLRRPDGEAFQHAQDVLKERRAVRRLGRIGRRRQKTERLLREEAERRRGEAERLARAERLRREESDRLREEAVRVADDERRRRESAEAEARQARQWAGRMAAKLREMGLEED